MVQFPAGHIKVMPAITRRRWHVRSFRQLAALFLPAMGLWGCAHVGNPDAPITLNTSTPLRIGESRLVAGTSTAVGVTELVEDSRCPTGVQCVWAGRVRMTLRLGDNAATLAADSSFAANGLSVRLDSVLPYPSSATRIATADYRAFVTVRDTR